MAAQPDHLIENPAGADVLSGVLRNVRLSGSLQFCFMPSGDWQTDAAPSLAQMGSRTGSAASFHLVVNGQCWLKIEDVTVELHEGDVVLFPFGTGHQLGAGNDGQLVTPVADLPPKPWRTVPVMRYGDGQRPVRLLCGLLHCDALNFGPLRASLPKLLHVRTAGDETARWLRATLHQIVAEVDEPRGGGQTMLERLSEAIFVELLRHRMLETQAGAVGWIAALADQQLARCLAVIHERPTLDWTLEQLGAAAGMSRSALADRFTAMLGISPMRYVREWRLHLASVALATSDRPIAAIAHEAGYGTEAAFNRAFSRLYSAPPATWRQSMASPSAPR